MERWVTNQIYLGGSGVAAGDVNGDGWTDLYFCGIDSDNALYLNEGNWRFRKAEGSGIDCKGDASMGAVLADTDGDGDLDLLAGGLGHGVRLFVNDGKGSFTERTDEAGLRSRAAVTTLALADVDGDGDLDLYAGTYALTIMADEPPKKFRLTRLNNRLVVAAIDGRQLTREQSRRYTVDQRSGEIQEEGDPDLFYRNEGGKFMLVPWSSGMFLNRDGKPLEAAPLDWTLTPMFRDMNDDGWPDLYVCNDNHSPDLIWTNTGHGKFQLIHPNAIGHTSLASMGVDFSDINRDGLDDIFVVDMLSPDEKRRLTQLPDRHGLHFPGGGGGPFQYLRNTLFLNRGDGTYSEIAYLAGLEASDWSWMPLFLDADLDGWEDVFITTGIERNFRHADFRRDLEAQRKNANITREAFFDSRRRLPVMRNPNYAFRNKGDLTFEDTSHQWGFDSTELSQGMCMADLDNDGDSDLVINCLNAPALLYRNEAAGPRVQVRLKGIAPNTQAIGAKIKVMAGNVILQQEVISGGRYLSSDDGSRSFAALSNNVTVQVRWRNGKQTIVHGVAANSIVEINEASSAVELKPQQPVQSSKWFAEVTHLKGLKHHEEIFNDLDRQPLLPKLLSQQGPGIAWGDLNRDGWDDLVIGQGRGGSLSFLLNIKGDFQKIPIGDELGPLPGDAAGILILPIGKKSAEVISGISSYESDTNCPSAANLLFGPEGIRLGPGLDGSESVTGPLAAADVDGNGTLEVFIGGYARPGKYPLPATSGIYSRQGPKLMLKQRLENLGVVSGAVFTDLDNDGFAELVVARELGPVEVFANRKGVFTRATREWKIDSHVGLWNSVTAVDLNNDGRMDLVAGNWGRNTRWERPMKNGWGVFYADTDQNGIVELIESAKTDGEWTPLRHWDALSAAVPGISKKFASYLEFSGAAVKSIINEGEWQHTTVTTLESSVFINQGNSFARSALPIEAQFSPVFGIASGDFNMDGNMDVFLAQNFFAVDRETSRYDAGRGLVLKGEGNGVLSSLKAQESGISLYGEMRAAALSDFDRDGRWDMVVGQNAAEVVLYRGISANPGMRITLEGPEGNEAGIGAQIRWQGAGTVHEVSAGTGFLSQNSTVTLVSQRSGLVEVKWPGGRSQLAKVTPEMKELAVKWEAPK